MSYSEAVKLVADGATYREALARYDLPSMGTLHRACKKAGISARSSGRPKFIPENALEAARLVRGGMTYRRASEMTGAHLSTIAKALKREADT